MEGTPIKNYISGGIRGLATLISILVNPCLIYYYRRFRTSWIHRYYYFLSIAHLCYAIFRGIPFTCELLLSSRLRSVSWKWYDEFLEVPAQLSGASVTTIVCVTVMVQHLNIYHPLWTVINGASQFRQYAILIIGSIYLTFYVPALVLLIIIRYENLLSNNQSNINKVNLIFCIPTILFTIFSSCLYVITRVKFLALNPEEDQIEITRKEFRIVNVLIVFGLVWMAATITYIILVFFDGSEDFSFAIMVCGKMEVLAQIAVTAGAIFFNENQVRSYFLFCRFQNGAG